MRIIVTGGNSGVGKATAAALAVAGHGGVMGLPLTPHRQRFRGTHRRQPPRPVRADVTRSPSWPTFCSCTNSRDAAYASDPGMTDTGITRKAAVGLSVGERNPVWRILQTPAQGARASIQAVTTDLPSGTYLAPRVAFSWSSSYRI